MGLGQNLPAGGPNYPFSMSLAPAPKGPLPVIKPIYSSFTSSAPTGPSGPKGAAPRRRRRQPSCEGAEEGCAPWPALPRTGAWTQELTFRFEGWVCPLDRRPLNSTLPRAETEQRGTN